MHSFVATLLEGENVTKFAGKAIIAPPNNSCYDVDCSKNRITFTDGPSGQEGGGLVQEQYFRNHQFMEEKKCRRNY
jgi:hypothetical protein